MRKALYLRAVRHGKPCRLHRHAGVSLPRSWRAETSGDGFIRVHETYDTLLSIRFSSDGSGLAYGGWRDGVQLLDTATHERITEQGTREVTAVAVTNDRKIVAAAAGTVPSHSMSGRISSSLSNQGP